MSYDWDFIEPSVKSWIDHVDELIMGLDENRLSWSGKPFSIPADAPEKVRALSPKIRLIEDYFYIAGLAPMECDTRERNLLSTYAQPGDWIVSVDADEIVINPECIKPFLQSQPDKDVCVYGYWITVYKELQDSYLVVGQNDRPLLSDMVFATGVPEQFKIARLTSQKRVNCPAVFLHFSWARTEEELYRKLTNWSHSDDFDTDVHMAHWRTANETNYKSFKDFHPLEPAAWPQLIEIKKSDLHAVAESCVADYKALAEPERLSFVGA